MNDHFSFDTNNDKSNYDRALRKKQMIKGILKKVS